MRTQSCRKQIDWVKLHCQGTLSDSAVENVKKATEFVEKKAPYLEMESTEAVNAIRTIEDPIIQGRVLQKVKDAINNNRDPRTGNKLHTRNKITRPMVKWLEEWARTGKKPSYRSPGSVTKISLSQEDLEILKIMKDGGLDLCHKRLWTDKTEKVLHIYERLMNGGEEAS